MKIWLASVCLLELVLLQNACGHGLPSSSIVKKAADHRAGPLGHLRQGAARRRDKLLDSIQKGNTIEKRAEANITWEVSPFNPTSIPLAVRR